ncbi:MAG: cbb3-type cytochrome oxidase assembly protein CcoS [Bacteroidales bacterium]
MSVIFFLIAIGIFVAGGFLVAFIWSVKSGQYDDDYTPSVRILFDHTTESGTKSNEAPHIEHPDKHNTEIKQSNNNKS